MDSFKNNRISLRQELYELCNKSLINLCKDIFPEIPNQRITYQGGIGTGYEQKFMIEHYELSGTGWGSPFLLVPEATNLDDNTLQALSTAEPDDFYLSNSSPLGIPLITLEKVVPKNYVMIELLQASLVTLVSKNY